MADDGMSWLIQVKFWLMLILSILSTICSISIFIYFYRQRKKLSLHHDLTLVLVILSFIYKFTHVPFALIFYHYGKVIPASDSFCLWWNWWVYSAAGSPVFVMAWGSIERHILIFHNSLVSTRRKRIIFHIIPTSGICIFPFIFYFVTIILNKCENVWDYSVLLCSQPCYLTDQPVLSSYDSIANVALPVGLTAIANIILIVRVLWQKRNRPDVWRRQRKLTFQLLLIAALFIIIWFPLTINGLIYTFTLLPMSGFLQWKYFLSLPSISIMLIPIILLPFLPDFKKIVFKWRNNVVASEVNNIQRLPNVQI